LHAVCLGPEAPLHFLLALAEDEYGALNAGCPESGQEAGARRPGSAAERPYRKEFLEATRLSQSGTGSRGRNDTDDAVFPL
jgi:hypothetical protein